MKTNEPQGVANSRERWMVSYVDVLSILLIFFMVAAAKSLPIAQLQQTHPVAATQPAARTETPKPAARPVVQSEIQPAAQPLPQTLTQPPVQLAGLGGEAQPQVPLVVAPAAVEQKIAAPKNAEPPVPPVDKHRAILLRAQERLKSQGLEPKLEPRGLVISVPQVILFSSGEDSVNPKALPTLEQIADVLREIPNEVRLVGHADTNPVHSRRFRSNWDLAMARSERILQLLSGRYGISESRLSIASYGPWHPAASNDTAGGRASNRRVEIIILSDSGSEEPQAE